MIDFSRTMNLSFWFSWSLSIVIILSSAISVKETNASLSLFIFEKKVIILSFFINFFIVNNRFFNTFIAFLKSSKTIENWITFFATLIIFFAKKEIFENIFFLNCAKFLLIRINSKNKNAIKIDESFLWKEKEEKTTKIEKICRLLKSTKKKSKRFKTSNITEFKNSVAATELSKMKKKFRKSKKRFWLFFSSIWSFFFSIEWSSSSQRKRHQNSNNSSFFDRTQNRAHIVCLRKQKNWTYIQFFFSDNTNRESHRSDCSNYMCFESSWDESRCARSTADIRIRFKRNQITFENSQTFVSYVIANVCVLEHVINVFSWFNNAKHSEEEEKEKEKKEKEKKKKNFSDFLKIEQITKDDEKRDSNDRRKLKEEKKKKELKKRRKNRTKKKMNWKKRREKRW